MKIKNLFMAGIASLLLTGCSGINIDVSPTVTATVHEVVENCTLVEAKDEVDTPYTLALVTLDKTTLFHYYVDVTARESTEIGAKFLVEYNKDKKMNWYLADGKTTVTNHGYTIIGEVK